MTKLSVNINKIATIRNARGGDIPNVVEAVKNCQYFGAHGITVHPRPDERHIRYKDVFDIMPVITTEFNIEGYPSDSFLRLVKEVKPHQVTLVPDPPDALTSNAGWDTLKHADFLKRVIADLKECGIRTSIFVDTEEKNIIHSKATGTDRIELYTEPFATMFLEDPKLAVAPFTRAAEIAVGLGLEINAGHDLNLQNLNYFAQHVVGLKEVSIGHALIADALYYGLENTIQMYLGKLK